MSWKDKIKNSFLLKDIKTIVDSQKDFDTPADGGTRKTDKVYEDEESEFEYAYVEKQIEMAKEAVNVVVTTCDLHAPYKIIAPITINTLCLTRNCIKKYNNPEIRKLIITPEMTDIYYEPSYYSLMQNTFYICVAEMKLKAYKLGGNAVIGMKMDMESRTIYNDLYYIQMYGTAVKTFDDTKSI